MPTSKRRKPKHQSPTVKQDTYPIFQSEMSQDIGCCTARVHTKLWANGDLDDRVTHATECSRSGKRTA
jgi:hypothetical protein